MKITTAACWRLIYTLPYKHPMRLQYSAAIHVPGMPDHIRRKFIQRTLKWAAKRLEHEAFLTAISKRPFIRGRDNQPLPLP